MITAANLKELYNKDLMTFLDVREVDEVKSAPFEGLDVTHIPMKNVPQEFQKLNKEKHIIVACRSGGRSQMICDFLEDEGFESVSNLQGGIIAWSQLG